MTVESGWWQVNVRCDSVDHRMKTVIGPETRIAGPLSGKDDLEVHGTVDGPVRGEASVTIAAGRAHRAARCAGATSSSAASWPTRCSPAARCAFWPRRWSPATSRRRASPSTRARCSTGRCACAGSIRRAVRGAPAAAGDGAGADRDPGGAGAGGAGGARHPRAGDAGPQAAHSEDVMNTAQSAARAPQDARLRRARGHPRLGQAVELLHRLQAGGAHRRGALPRRHAHQRAAREHRARGARRRRLDDGRRSDRQRRRHGVVVARTPHRRLLRAQGAQGPRHAEVARGRQDGQAGHAGRHRRGRVHHRRLHAQGDRARAAARARRQARLHARRSRRGRARGRREGGAADRAVQARATFDEAAGAAAGGAAGAPGRRLRVGSDRGVARRAVARSRRPRTTSTSSSAGRATRTCARTSTRRSTSTPPPLARVPRGVRRQVHRPVSHRRGEPGAHARRRSSPTAPTATSSTSRPRRTTTISTTSTSAKTVWRVTLVDDQGHEVQPAHVCTRSRSGTRSTRSSTPTPTIFSRGWTLRFPRTRPDGTPLVGSDTKALTLRFAGPQGSVDLRLGPEVGYFFFQAEPVAARRRRALAARVGAARDRRSCRRWGECHRSASRAKNSSSTSSNIDSLGCACAAALRRQLRRRLLLRATPSRFGPGVRFFGASFSSWPPPRPSAPLRAPPGLAGAAALGLAGARRLWAAGARRPGRRRSASGRGRLLGLASVAPSPPRARPRCRRGCRRRATSTAARRASSAA